jgi:hypothetical protein
VVRGVDAGSICTAAARMNDPSFQITFIDSYTIIPLPFPIRDDEDRKSEGLPERPIHEAIAKQTHQLLCESQEVVDGLAGVGLPEALPVLQHIRLP